MLRIQREHRLQRMPWCSHKQRQLVKSNVSIV
uniref:Uncharacterized protein n=1 Tax=Anguilla anguilla TaxID=7936 RepID=A0A0E9SFY1_ANGAN